MPGFSVFQDFVAFKFSGKPTRGESIYKALVAAEAGAFDLTPGTYEEARLYATAMGLARARYALERAQNQTDPLKAIELLPQLEHDWGVVPREVDGIVARQRRVAAAFLLAKGALLRAMETALRSILGTDFLALVPMDPTLATVDESLGLFTNPKLPFKLVRISPVTATGIPFVVDYVNADVTSAPVAIDVDDMLVVEPENTGLQEVVTVTAVDTIGKTFTATFAHAHDDQSFASTQNYVPWTSTQCSLMVVAKAASALDAEARRLVNEFMEKVCRGVWTWSIVEPTTPGALTIGPFALDSSPLGAVPLGSFPFFYIPVAPPFHRATLNLTGWWIGGNLAAGIWTGTASAGNSGTHPLAVSTGSPGTGPALNGVPSVSFIRTNTDALTTAVPDSGFISAAAWSGWALVQPVSINRDPVLPSAFTDVIFRSGGYNWSVGFKNTGPLFVASQSADSGSTWLSASTAAAIGAPHLYQFKYDGTQLWVRKDNGPWVSQAVGNIGLTGGGFVMGDSNFTGYIWEAATSQQIFSNATFDNIRADINADYGTSF